VLPDREDDAPQSAIRDETGATSARAARALQIADVAEAPLRALHQIHPVLAANVLTANVLTANALPANGTGSVVDVVAVQLPTGEVIGR
jgi:hypothetical protein